MKPEMLDPQRLLTRSPLSLVIFEHKRNSSEFGIYIVEKIASVNKFTVRYKTIIKQYHRNILFVFAPSTKIVPKEATARLSTACCHANTQLITNGQLIIIVTVSV